MQLYGSSRVGNRIHTRHLLQEPLGGTKLPDRWSAGDYASLAAQGNGLYYGWIAVSQSDRPESHAVLDEQPGVPSLEGISPCSGRVGRGYPIGGPAQRERWDAMV